MVHNHKGGACSRCSRARVESELNKAGVCLYGAEGWRRLLHAATHGLPGQRRRAEHRIKLALELAFVLV